LKHPDAEVRKRVGEIIPDLETALLVAPKLVTLKAEKKTARQLLMMLSEQTGYKMEVWNDDAQQLFTVDFRDVPFWKVIDEIGKKSVLTPLGVYTAARPTLHHT